MISFKEVEKEGDIIFNCRLTAKYDYGANSETIGETLIYRTDLIIDRAEISLYGGISKECMNFPTTEIHEILHALGFEHNNYAQSIMYPYNSCKRELYLHVDQKIFDELKDIYS